MVVLLTENPQKLITEWIAVEDAIRGADKVLVATTDSTVALPTQMDGIERIDASKDSLDSAVNTVLSKFEEDGFR